MNTFKKIFPWIVGIGLILLLSRGTESLEEEFQKDIYMEWMRNEPSEWQGIIRVWNLYTSDNRIDPDWLQKCMTKFEKKNTGVFVEMISITSSEAYVRLQNGEETPDLWIFPADIAVPGAETDVQFALPIPQEEKTIKSEFEFDISEPEESPNTPVNEMKYCNIWVRSTEFERAEYSRLLSDFIAEQALTMLE